MRAEVSPRYQVSRLTSSETCDRKPLRAAAVALTLLVAGCASARVVPDTRLAAGEVVGLCRAQVNEWHIEMQLRERGAVRPDADGLVALKQAGASDVVIDAMMVAADVGPRPRPRPAPLLGRGERRGGGGGNMGGFLQFLWAIAQICRCFGK